MFEDKKSRKVCYDDFLTAFKSASAMGGVRGLLFGQAAALISRKKGDCLSRILQDAAGISTRDDYMSFRDLQKAFDRLNIRVRDDEIDQLIVEYDPNGKGLCLKEIEDDFNDFNGKDYKSKNFGHKEDKYREFDEYCNKHPNCMGGHDHDHDRRDSRDRMDSRDRHSDRGDSRDRRDNHGHKRDDSFDRRDTHGQRREDSRDRRDTHGHKRDDSFDRRDDHSHNRRDDSRDVNRSAKFTRE